MTVQAGFYEGRRPKVLPKAASLLIPGPPPNSISIGGINIRAIVLQLPPCTAYLGDGATSPPRPEFPLHPYLGGRNPSGITRSAVCRGGMQHAHGN